MTADATEPSLGVGLLGVLAVHVDGLAVEVPGARRRTVLVTLALNAGSVVTNERLVDLPGPGEPPRAGVRAIWNHVSRLRKQPGPAGHRLSTRESGYRLDLRDDELDVRTARRLAARSPRQSAAEV